MKTVSEKKTQQKKQPTPTPNQKPPTFHSTLKLREATIAVIQRKAALKKIGFIPHFWTMWAIHRTRAWYTFLVPSGLGCGSSASVYTHPHIAETYHPRLISFQQIRPESKSRCFGKPPTHNYPNEQNSLMSTLKCQL